MQENGEEHEQDQAKHSEEDIPMRSGQITDYTPMVNAPFKMSPEY